MGARSGSQARKCTAACCVYLISAEQSLKQVFAAYLQVAGNVSQDRGQGSNFQRIVRGNCKVVPGGSFESKTKMVPACLVIR